MSWLNYYKDLPIPKDWKDVSWGNDELPSFSCNGYQIFINAPTKVEREDFYINTMGFDNLDIYEDWQFVVQYERDYGEVSNDLLYSLDFQEVVDFVNKPTLYGLVGVLEYEFNHQLPFREWEDEELIQFIKDLLNGKTEYKLDDSFPKNTFINFLKEII
jgi:hypothetical protein|tara:strand:- start:430 stop:906 length:477 start_codon:yes stop_codon:yes gene_type:complete